MDPSSSKSTSTSSPAPPPPPPPGAIHHKHKDFWSADNPIPSIQRFVKKGFSEVVNKDSEESDSDDSSIGEPISPTAPTSPSSRQRNRLSRLFGSGRSAAKDDDDHRSQGDAGEGLAQQDDADIADEPSDAHQDPSRAASDARRRTRKPRLVDDPITGQQTWIHDVSRKEYRRAMKTMDDLYADEARSKHDGKAHGPPPGPRRRGPFADSENVMTMPFPPEPSLPATIRDIHPLLIPLFLAWGIITILGVLPAVLSVGLNAWLGWWTWKSIRESAEDHRWQRERARGEAARGKLPAMGQAAAASAGSAPGHSDDLGFEGVTEGAEWLNGILEGLWEVLNPQLFSSLGGTLEDVMQASIPGFVHAVKVVDVAQGSTPLRLTGLRILPDNDKDIEVLHKAAQRELRKKRLREKVMKDPHEEEVLRRLEEEDARDTRGASKGPQTAEELDSGKKVRGEEGAGSTFINVELAFVYRARPTVKTVASKSRNAHLQIKFWLGARKVYSVPLPVLVEIKGLVGRVRMRVQLTPDPPFVKNVTLSLVGLPRVGVEVVPFLRLNTSNLPFISSFIQSSIDAATSEYVAPNSLTMDVGEILMGDNIKREVDALGVLVVYIHSASDLEAQDLGGSSDPYCTVSLAKYGKVQYATRVALNDLSPRWEERHVMTISPEAVRAREKVAIALWDSDRFTPDDMLGRAEVDLLELVNRPGRLFRRKDPLIGLSREMKKEGTIEWSVGFFAKAPNRPSREKAKGIEQMVEGKGGGDKGEGRSGGDGDGDSEGDDDDNGRNDPVDETKWDAAGEATNQVRRLSQEAVKEGESFADQMLRQDDGRQTRHQETAVQFEPPNPSLPSGILSMQIHQIANLESADHGGGSSLRRRRNGPGQDVETVETEEEPPSAPSAYVSIIINDETVFRTRTKALSRNPFYNAGTERFIRDWRRTLLMFVVHDYRLREADTILGVVAIRLTDLFKETSQVTQFFPIAGGVGYGRIRLSLLFRPIMAMTRVKSKLGWNIGTVRLLTSPVATDFVEGTGFTAHDLHLTSLRARTLAGSNKVSAHRARHTDDGKSIEWKIRDDEFPFRVPARRRYAAPYMIEFRGHNALGKHKVIAMCIVWMQDLSDDEVTSERLPIYRPKPGHDFHRLRQNYHDYRREAEAEALGVEKVGYLEVKMQFKSGLGEVHVELEENRDAKAVMQAWQCCVAAGLRDKKGDFAKSRLNTQGYLEDEKRQVDLGTELGDSERDSDGDGDGDGDGDSDDGGEKRAGTRPKYVEGSNMVRSPTASSGSGSGSGSDHHRHDDDDDDDDAAGEEEDPTLRERMKRWRDEKRERHRQHRGVKQFKAVRTASWLGSSAKSGSSSLFGRLNIQDRRTADVETEL